MQENLNVSIADRFRRGELMAVDCPSRDVLRHITSLWGTLVLLILREGTLRFSDLRRKAAGVSEKMLAETLQKLEADGLVHRRAYPVIPPHVEYSLTALGQEAAGKVAELTDWIELNLGKIMEARQVQAAQSKGSSGGSTS